MKKTPVFIAVFVLTAICVRGQSQYFSSAEFGFTMMKPDGWFEVDRRVLEDSISRMEMSEATRADLKRESDDSILLFLFAKYMPDSKRGINPKIEARVIRTGLSKDITFEEFEPAINAAFRSLGTGRKDYIHLQEPASLGFAGAKGVSQISRFSIRTGNRTEYTIRSRTIAIPYKNYYFQISFVDEFGGEDCSAVFDELVKSIKIGNHY